MQHDVWNTKLVDEHQQFDFYRSGLCASFAHLTPEIRHRDVSFSAAIQNWCVDGRKMTRMNATRHDIFRTREGIREAEDDGIYLNYVVSGPMRFVQGSQCVELPKGGMFLLDNANLFEVGIVAKTNHDHISIRLPRSSFEVGGVPHYEHIAKHPVSNLIQAQLNYISENSSSIDHVTLSAALEGVELLCGYLTRPASLDPASARARNTYDKLKLVISKGFADSNLTLEAAASEMRMSQRTLQHHLTLVGVRFSDVLRQVRLYEARRLILSGTPISSVENIAFRCGFNDISTFYRAFSREFGMAPRAMVKGR